MLLLMMMVLMKTRIWLMMMNDRSGYVGY